MRLVRLGFGLLIPLVLAACSPSLEAPRDTGVCWHMVTDNQGKPKFNRLADRQPDLEHCAAQLEMMRLRFRVLGLNQNRLTGAYQGQFLFIQPEGVFTAQSYNGYHYPFMVRTGDGRLAVPGAMPQGQ
ncbi:MAG: hypothetical protein JWO83_3863 [Caulobacteraceae bacterium]|jgi:hypothetical protein|nr:hypothetical protein [Caulobacteraceae bacterium]